MCLLSRFIPRYFTFVVVVAAVFVVEQQCPFALLGRFDCTG
jgi:predicted GNAT family N-acyltransferase